MPRRKLSTLYPLALPFGLLRRLGLSKGTGHRAGGQVRLPSHTAQAQAVLLRGEVTFKSSPGPCGGRPVLKAGCRIMAWLVLMGHVESWKRKCPWLFICPHTACPCYQHRAAVGHAVVGDARGSAQAPRKTYTMCPVSNRTKSWKGFDSEIQNYFQVRANLSSMLLHPRVKFLAWLSMIPHWDTAE